MTFQTQLRIPGPTPLPERVVRSMNRPMIDHRGPEFAAILVEITAGAKRVFKTKNDLLLLTSSGTGGLESAVANLISPGDEVVAALCGNFGELFAALASAYGAEVGRLEFEWGRPVDPDDLAVVLERHSKAKVVLLTHNETSTGLTNPLRELARVARKADRIVVVDGVSSISSIDIETDAWGIDVAVSGSQKGWMAPAGLRALGFQLFAAEGFRSHTVTSALPPPGLDVAALRKLVDTRYGVVIAGGQGKMTGKMIRVGHLGAVAEGDVVQVIWTLEQALEELDIAPADGRGVAAVTASVQGVPAAAR